MIVLQTTSNKEPINDCKESSLFLEISPYHELYPSSMYRDVWEWHQLVLHENISKELRKEN
jgi:hypothetical protein